MLFKYWKRALSYRSWSCKFCLKAWCKFLGSFWLLLIFSTQTRARLSFKRRPPTRQHRRSAGEEAGALGSSLSPCELHSPKENGNQDQGIDNPAEEDEYGKLGSLKEAEDKDTDCEKTEDKLARSDPDDKGDPETEQTSEQAQSLEGLEEEQQPSEPCPAEQIESDVKTEEGQEEMTQEAHRGENDEAWTANVYIRKKTIYE